MKRAKNSTLPTELDLEPEAWSRFERAVDAAVKDGPKPQDDGTQGREHISAPYEVNWQLPLRLTPR